MNELRPPFPFSALLGQERLQLALLLVAIEPRIGGVLIDGPRGTAKSTSARAIAELLPGGSFVTLPLGATLEMLIGTLSIDAALQSGTVTFSPGLLAKAHGGVLYVDEVNLLPDVLVDQLLDAASSGCNTIERDGISHQHAASFALIGTMNPEEGELRPQLLDRFGLALSLQDCTDVAIRRDIVKTRLAFEQDPIAFRQQFSAAQTDLSARVMRARTELPRIGIDDGLIEHISALCLDAHVDGLRADLVIARAAKALAAWRGESTVTQEHIDVVAPLALHHRRHASRPQNAPAREPDESPVSRPWASQPPSQPQWGAMEPPPLSALPSRSIDLPAQKKSR